MSTISPVDIDRVGPYEYRSISYESRPTLPGSRRAMASPTFPQNSTFFYEKLLFFAIFTLWPPSPTFKTVAWYLWMHCWFYTIAMPTMWFNIWVSEVCTRVFMVLMPLNTSPKINNTIHTQLVRLPTNKWIGKNINHISSWACRYWFWDKDRTRTLKYFLLFNF